MFANRFIDDLLFLIKSVKETLPLKLLPKEIEREFSYGEIVT